MRIALYSIPMFLLLAAGTAQAQANRIPADRTPTSGVTETPTLPPRISTSPATDSVMAGGDAVPLPGGQWNMGGTPNPGNQPPPVPGPGLVFGSRYVADDTYSHDAEASVTLTIKADGTCQARIWQSKTALSGTLPCGNAVPSGGMASQYEVQFVADQMVPTVDAPYCNSDDLNPTYTPTTGWLALGSVDRSVVAQTAHVMGNTYGCTGSFESAIEGVYRVRVRKIGETAYSEVVMEFLARAQAGA